jgi:hypothetical protein
MPNNFRARRALSECGSLLPLLKTLKIHVFRLFIESGSKLPHSKGFASQKTMRR